jgi:hypothetical protein
MDTLHLSGWMAGGFLPANWSDSLRGAALPAAPSVSGEIEDGRPIHVAPRVELEDMAKRASPMSL